MDNACLSLARIGSIRGVEARGNGWGLLPLGHTGRTNTVLGEHQPVKQPSKVLKYCGKNKLLHRHAAFFGSSEIADGSVKPTEGLQAVGWTVQRQQRRHHLHSAVLGTELLTPSVAAQRCDRVPTPCEQRVNQVRQQLTLQRRQTKREEQQSGRGATHPIPSATLP